MIIINSFYGFNKRLKKVLNIFEKQLSNKFKIPAIHVRRSADVLRKRPNVVE